MVFYVVKLLNYFPVKGGVSEISRPKAIMSGKVLDFKFFSLLFGSYCQVHEEKLPCNSLVNRTLEAISLEPSGNGQGWHKCFTLNTSQVITHWSWDVIPMPKSVVDRVNFIGRDQPSQTMFLNHSGNPIGDGDAAYEEDKAHQTRDLPGKVIPEVAPDHVKITGVDMEDVEPIEFQADNSMSPAEIPGVDTTQQTIEINDLDESLPPEPALVKSAPQQAGQEHKATKKYDPSMSGKNYAYSQLGLLFLQDTHYNIQVRLWKWS
jgi:hypothetical protein